MDDDFENDKRDGRAPKDRESEEISESAGDTARVLVPDCRRARDGMLKSCFGCNGCNLGVAVASDAVKLVVRCLEANVDCVNLEDVPMGPETERVDIIDALLLGRFGDLSSRLDATLLELAAGGGLRRPPRPRGGKPTDKVEK